MMLLIIGASLFNLQSINAQTVRDRWVGDDLNGNICFGSTASFGPFDYTQRHLIPKQRLDIVERAHFTHNVELLIKGNTTTLPYGDLAYTLRAWPNHHRALNAMGKYNIRLKRQNKRIPISAECWFQRAINYSRKDATTHMLFAMYLHNLKKHALSEKYYEAALKLDHNNIQTHYNYGLLLVDIGKYNQAKKHAQIAYDNGYPLPGLKRKLSAIGYWP